MAFPSFSRPPQGYDAFSTLNPQQSQLLQQLLGSLSGNQGNISQNPLYQSGQSYLQQLLSGSPESFKNFEAPYLTQFNEEIVPGIAERFSSLGARNSSGFQQSLGQAASGLSQGLASLRSNLQMQAVPQALGYAQQPFSNLFNLLNMNTQGFTPKPLSGLQQLLASLGGGLSQGLGTLGGMYGANKFLG